MAIEVKKYALRQSKDGTIISFVLHPHDDATELVTAPIGAVFSISLELIYENEPEAYTVKTERERLRTRAVLLCKDKGFQELHGCMDEGGAAYFVKYACRIKSRSELATNVEAQKRFLEIERQYRASPVQGQD